MLFFYTWLLSLRTYFLLPICPLLSYNWSVEILLMNSDEDPPFFKNRFEFIILVVGFILVSFGAKYYLFYLFDNSIKKVIQCTCAEFCENIRFQHMYAKCPKIQSTYFVNRDIYMHRVYRVVPKMSFISGQPTSIESMSSRTQFTLYCCKIPLHFIIKYNNIFLSTYQTTFQINLQDMIDKRTHSFLLLPLPQYR